MELVQQHGSPLLELVENDIETVGLLVGVVDGSVDVQWRRSVTRRSADPNDQPIRASVLRLCKSTGWSLPAIAARIGVSEKTLTRWRCGDRAPTPAQATAVVKALREVAGVDLDELAGFADLAGIDAEVADVLLGHEAPAPPSDAPAAPPRASAEAVRVRVDLSLLATAERLDLSPRGLREAVRAVLEAAESSGYTVAELRAIL